MSAEMRVLTSLLIISAILLSTSSASKEIVGVLEQAKDLSPEEIAALHPLFDELQTQYDYILSEATQDGEKVDPTFTELYTKTRQEFETFFDGLLEPRSSQIEYDTTLPTVEKLLGDLTPTADMTEEQVNELLDMQSLLQEVLDEAQTHIDAVVALARLREASAREIDKPKVVAYIYNALRALFNVSVRVSRAAYCTYSHVPQLNESLHEIYDGVDCYEYTKDLILRIEQETVNTIQAIKDNVNDLAKIYQKVAEKKSVMGKIIAIIMNISNIIQDIRNIYDVGVSAQDKIENNLPTAVNGTVQCGRDLATNLPHIIETVTNVTTCILFVDDTTTDYEWMHPQEEQFKWSDDDDDFIDDE